MAAVTLNAVRKSYGDFEVVHGVDLDIPHNEFLVLVGPSGCGKSTLLRMVAGLEDITSGEIAIDGVVVNEREPKDRDIAMVFQDYALYPHMSVFENMAFALQYRGYAKPAIRERVEQAARILNITELLDRRPRQLSGGQRQRVAMGRAIVRDPKVFLFDEPLSNLDAKLRVQMRTEIKRLHQKVATTVIYVTHDQVEAMTLADRIVVLRAGIIEQVGTPEEIYDRPATMFVAGFIGAPTMNLVPARLEASGEALNVRLGDGTALSIPPEQGARYGGRQGSDVIFGIRPEHLEWTPDGAAANGTALRTIAQVIEPLGSDTLVFFDLAGREMVSRVPPRAVQRSGAPVVLRARMDAMHLFDPQTERAL